MEENQIHGRKENESVIKVKLNGMRKEELLEEMDVLSENNLEESEMKNELTIGELAKTLQCNQCEWSTKWSGDLKKHIDSKHRGIRFSNW